MHQRRLNIHPTDMHTVGVHHICHDIRYHVLYGNLFRLTWKVSWHFRWDILLQYLNKMWIAMKHVAVDNFVFRWTAHWHMCSVHVKHSQTAGSRSLIFISFNYGPPLNSPADNTSRYNFQSHTLAWALVASQQDWRNKAATDWILRSSMQHMTEKTQFCV